MNKLIILKYIKNFINNKKTSQQISFFKIGSLFDLIKNYNFF